jgi:hypothetical protein
MRSSHTTTGSGSASRQDMDRVQRRAFLLAAGALAAAPFVVDAQQAAKVPRIGYMALDLASNPRGMDSFRQRLRELGYEEGRSIVIEIRDAERRFDRFPALAAELVALKVDVIVAPSVLASQASCGCRGYSRRGSSSTPAGSWPTARVSTTCWDAAPSTWTSC